MAIYEVIRYDIHCDGCGRFLCSGEGPRRTIEMLEKTQVKCENCGGAPLRRPDKSTKKPN